ncbi:putative YeeE/YedE family protein [Seiridium unicorne]|uniref:YeeE/YedE family protein n=1 Tax=Seiridium unicorne TaxID=138068 RepID=A0ABR2UE51_9PEZI
MALDILTTAFCGSAFGVALTASGVHRPDVIISQLTLSNFDMLESFLTAAASSLALVTICQRLGFVRLPPRSYSSIGIFGYLDGNIVGGLTQGAGMALAGSCPGTVFAQVGAGIQSGLYTLSGLIIGGILWTGILQPYVRSRSAKKEKSTTPTSIDKRIGTSHIGAVAVVEAIFTTIIVVAVSNSADKTKGLVHPVSGGFLIAGAQLVSAMLRKTLLGTSTAFEEVGNCFWSVVGRGSGRTNAVSYINIVFVSGMTLGAYLVAIRYPSVTGSEIMVFDRMKVMAGGVLLAIGSRMAGGCTSGHGISGISLLSVSSYVTVAAMFTGAIGTALALADNQ